MPYSEFMMLTPGTTGTGPYTSPPPQKLPGETIFTLTNVTGMTFYYYVQTQDPFMTSEGLGTFKPVQLVNLDHSCTVSNPPPPPNDTTNSTYMLDNNYPYLNLQPVPAISWQATNPVGQTTVDSPYYSMGDGAGLILSLNAQFNAQMFLVYNPPPTEVGASNDVPVIESDWNWNATAGYPQGSSVWGLTSQGPAQALGPQTSPGFADFVWSNTKFNNYGQITHNEEKTHN
jgi:hypothetical protein